MEIKDLNPKGPPVQTGQAASKETDSKQRSGQTLSAEKLSLSARSDSVTVEIKSKPSSAATTAKGDRSERRELNSVVSTLNQIEEKTGSIEKLTESLYGVLQQASDDNIPENRSAALVDETRQLAEQLKVERDSTRILRSDPPPTDETLKKIEDRVGRALDAIFSNDEVKPPAKSTKTAIIETLGRVENFRAQLKEVESTLAASKQEISELVSSREEVALANTEAARSSVRDVAQAAEMMERVSQEIGNSSPSAAIVNELNPGSLRLLSDTPEQ